MPYEINFENQEQKASFDTWYAGIKQRYPNVQDRDAVIKEELKNRGLMARAKHYPVDNAVPSMPQYVPVSPRTRWSHKSKLYAFLWLLLCLPLAVACYIWAFILWRRIGTEDNLFRTFFFGFGFLLWMWVARVILTKGFTHFTKEKERQLWRSFRATNKATGINGQIQILQDAIRIERKGFAAFLVRLSKKGKDVPIAQISVVHFARTEGLLSEGFMQFSLKGGPQNKLTISHAPTDENAVMFRKYQQPVFEEVKSLIELKMSEVVDIQKIVASAKSLTSSVPVKANGLHIQSEVVEDKISFAPDKAKGFNGQIEVVGDRIRIERSFFARMNMTAGAKKVMEISVSEISAIHFNPATGRKMGFIQFVLKGRPQDKLSLSQAGRDRDSVTFVSSQQAAFEAIKALIESKMSAKPPVISDS